jgi:hypothetical protein
MEHVGKEPGIIHFSAHSLKYYWRIGTEKTATTRADDFADSFHVYAMEWGPDTIRGCLDTLQYFTALNEHSDWQAWPFDKRFHFILNIALGGDWGGAIDNGIFPQRMVVDYVKVYAWNKNAAARPARAPASSVPALCAARAVPGGVAVIFPSVNHYKVELFEVTGRLLAWKTIFGDKAFLNAGIRTKGMCLVRITGPGLASVVFVPVY